MKIENLPDLSIGQFAGVTNDTLLMNNCIAKRSRRYKVDKGFIPFKYIKKLEIC